MLHPARPARLWRAVLSDRSATQYVHLLARLAGVALAAMLLVAAGTSAFIWSRTAALHSVAYPALSDVRQLDALLVSTRDALRIDDASGLARADSLADQFHRLAEAARQRPTLRDAASAADGEFRAYYAQARHRWLRTERRTDAVGDGLADITFRALRVQLDAVEATQRREIADAYTSMQQLQLLSGIIMALVMLATITMLGSLAGKASRAASEPLENAVHRVQRLAEGDFDVERGAGSSGADDALQQALARIASMVRANQTAAEELAAGEYRIGSHDGVPDDRTGRALARVSAYLDYLSIAAQRVAEGDLMAVVEPRSQDDTLGHAFGMMIQRVTSIVRELDATAKGIAVTAGDVHRAAAELASGATHEASAVRRAVDQLASISSELERNAARVADLERRTADTVSTMEEGTAVLQDSHGAVQRILGRAAVVGDIARDAGLIALNTGIEVGRAGAHGTGFVAVADEVRALAGQAAEAAREIGALTVHGSDAATRSVAMLARVAPAMSQCVSLVRELSATSGQRATELAQTHRQITATSDAHRRSTAAAEALAATAEALVGQAERLRAMLAQFHDAGQSAERAESTPSRQLSLHKSSTERRGAARRLALV